MRRKEEPLPTFEKGEVLEVVGEGNQHLGQKVEVMVGRERECDFVTVKSRVTGRTHRAPCGTLRPFEGPRGA